MGVPMRCPPGPEKFIALRHVLRQEWSCLNIRQAADLVTFVLTAYDDGFAVTAPVGSFEANARGMYDMSGNVSEWVNDFFEIRPVRGEPLVDPTGPETGDRHVVRGASWAKASRSELRLAYRNAGRDGNLDTGFRIARYVDKAGAKP